jgi:methane monooxygenase component C
MDQQYKITARFEDGAEFNFECGETENILSAALRQDVRLICQCRKAYCGSCKALCSEGDYELGKHINVQVLPPDEEEDGIVVTCDTFPRSDLLLEFAYNSDRLGMMSAAKDCFAKVMIVERISSIVYRLVLQPIDEQSGQPVPFDFVPGQYAEIGVPGTDKARAFSVSNAPTQEGLLEFIIRLVPGGVFAEYLTQRAEPGQTMSLRGPMGDFWMKETPRAQVFVGGSTGLAPLISMLRDACERQAKGEFHLFFGMQDADCMFFEKELKVLASSMPNLTVHLALIYPPQDWKGFTGNSVSDFEHYFAKRTDKPEVYLCGPAPMIEAAVAACQRLEVPSEQVNFEEFIASGG